MTVMKLSLLTLPALALLSGCQTILPAGKGDVYVAKGNEPGWILKITDDTLDYVGNYGETKINLPKPVGKPTFNGMSYHTTEFFVDITYSPCTDDMSGQRYADTVAVQVSKSTYNGCGGKMLPPENLEGTRWQVVSINSQPVVNTSPTDIAFDGQKMTGTVGCNRLNGTYSISGNVISFGPIAATRMACPGPLMAQETAFSALLAKPVTQRFTASGDWVLTNADGNTAVLLQVI